MNTVKYSIYIILIAITFQLNAQNYSRFYTNYNNDFALNPALASKKDYSQIGLNFINEWLGFEGSPMMVNLYGTIIEEDVERWATSIILDYESFGLSNYFNIAPGYSFNIINYDRTFSLASSINYRGISFDSANLPQDIDAETQSEFGVTIGGYYASVAPSDEYETTHYYIGLSSQILKFGFDTEGDRSLFSNGTLLLGYKYFLNEIFHFEPRFNIGYNFGENSIYTSSLNVEFEQYDYAYADRFGWYTNLGFIYNSQVSQNFDLEFNTSFSQGSYLTIGGGLILNPGSGNNVVKSGGFFEYGLNSLSNTNTINFGIQLNYFLFDLGW